MNSTDFQYIADLLKTKSGLVISSDKGYLLESRLNPLLRKWGLGSQEELVQALRSRLKPQLETEVIEAMTTNESYFFRDTNPFDQFRDVVLPQLLEKRAATRKLRIWSAACSSGQEPYSLCMMLKEMEVKLRGWTIEIIATDISNEILDKAKGGLYTQFEVQRGLPITHLLKYFKQEGDRWRINPDLRSMVNYRYFNLLDDPSSLGRFDVVFLRNVLIYFDQPTKTKVLEGIARQMPDDGFLYLGGAETVLGISDCFRMIPEHRGLYATSGGASKPQPHARPHLGFKTA